MKHSTIVKAFVTILVIIVLLLVGKWAAFGEEIPENAVSMVTEDGPVWVISDFGLFETVDVEECLPYIKDRSNEEQDAQWEVDYFTAQLKKAQDKLDRLKAETALHKKIKQIIEEGKIK